MLLEAIQPMTSKLYSMCICYVSNIQAQGNQVYIPWAGSSISSISSITISLASLSPHPTTLSSCLFQNYIYNYYI
jgi:hypothetical protein